MTRWRPQLEDLFAGRNVYLVGHDAGGRAVLPEAGEFPNPPIGALLVYPTTFLPPVAGATTACR